MQIKKGETPMATKQVSARELVDRLIEENPENIRRFLEVIRTSGEIDLDDSDLYYDFFTSPISYDDLEKELTERIDKLQTVTDALKAKTVIDVPKPNAQAAAN